MFHELFDIRAIFQGLLLQRPYLQEVALLSDQARRTPLLLVRDKGDIDDHELDLTDIADYHEFVGW